MSASSLVSLAIARTLEVKGAAYFTRPAGSSVDGLNVADGEAVADFLLSHEWEDVTEEATEYGTRYGKCRYFRATIGAEYTGQEGIALLSEISDEDLKNVRIVRGHHGNLELQLPGQAPHPTRVMHIIVGSYESFPDGEVTDASAGVITWYPGRMTAPVGIELATVKFTR
jgi:hypothetical protein